MSATYAPPAAPTSRPWVTAGLAAVPVAWCAVVVGVVMRPDAIAAWPDAPGWMRRITERPAGPPEVNEFRTAWAWHTFKWLLYDESDLTALALRGANAHMGRLPGRRDEPDDSDYPEDLAAKLEQPPPPLADRFYLEYPTPTLVLFRLGFLGQPRRLDLLPAQVADAQQFAVGFYQPRTDAEKEVWTRLRSGVVAILVAMTAAQVGLILVLRRGYEPGDPPPWTWLCVLPGAVFFSLNRFDVLPTLFTALGFALMARKRDGWSGAAFAAGALLKVYPALLAPVILRYLGVERGKSWVAAFAGTGLAAMGVSVWQLGLESTWGPIAVQLSRPFIEHSWTLYDKVFPHWLARHGEARLAILAVAMFGVAVTRPAGLPGLLRRCAVVLVVFAMLAVFWSPQWVVWFLPLLAPLAPRRWWVGAWMVLLDVANYFNFPILFWVLWSGLGDEELRDFLAGAMIYLRGALWVGLAGGLVYDEWRAKRAVTCPAAPGTSPAA